MLFQLHILKISPLTFGLGTQRLIFMSIAIPTDPHFVPSCILTDFRVDCPLPSLVAMIAFTLHHLGVSLCVMIHIIWRFIGKPTIFVLKKPAFIRCNASQ